MPTCLGAPRPQTPRQRLAAGCAFASRLLRPLCAERSVRNYSLLTILFAQQTTAYPVRERVRQRRYVFRMDEVRYLLRAEAFVGGFEHGYVELAVSRRYERFRAEIFFEPLYRQR